MCVCLCVGSRVVWMIVIQMSNNAVLFSVWLRIFSTSQGDGLTLPCPFIYINQTPAEVMIYLSLHLHRPPSWYPFQGPPSPCNQGNDHYHKGPRFPEILDGGICIIVSHHPDILFVLQVVTSPFCCVVTYLTEKHTHPNIQGLECGLQVFSLYLTYQFLSWTFLLWNLIEQPGW